MTVDQWLEKIYSADIRGKLDERLSAFKEALDNDPVLEKAAVAKAEELNALFAARGTGCCEFSMRCLKYLQSAIE